MSGGNSTLPKSAPTAPGSMEERSTILLLVQDPERTLLRAPFALCAPRHEEIGIGLIPGPGMDRFPSGSHLHALNGFEGRCRPILNRFLDACGCPRATRRIDPWTCHLCGHEPIIIIRSLNRKGVFRGIGLHACGEYHQVCRDFVQCVSRCVFHLKHKFLARCVLVNLGHFALKKLDILFRLSPGIEVFHPV